MTRPQWQHPVEAKSDFLYLFALERKKIPNFLSHYVYYFIPGLGSHLPVREKVGLALLAKCIRLATRIGSGLQAFQIHQFCIFGLPFEPA